MIKNWQERSSITANLLNPAFCGEIIRRTIGEYNKFSNSAFPFTLIYFILPIVLHKKTRENLPNRTDSYFHFWINANENLFIDFAERVSSLIPYTKEAMLFLLKYKTLTINDDSKIEVFFYRKKKLSFQTDETKEILKKSEFLGKWMAMTGNAQTIYMFLKVRP